MSGDRDKPLQRANRDAVEDRINDLSAALAKLPSPPLAPDRRDAIPYRDRIPGIARQLMLMARVDTDPKVARAARAKLAKVTALAAALAAKIERLSDQSDETDAALMMLDCVRRLQVVDLGTQARNFANAVRLPAKRERREGRPRKAAAAKVASYLALEFERLTGEPPTRAARGAFVELVTAVFTILKIKAKPGTVARAECIRLAKGKNSRRI